MSITQIESLLWAIESCSVLLTIAAVLARAATMRDEAEERYFRHGGPHENQLKGA